MKIFLTVSLLTGILFPTGAAERQALRAKSNPHDDPLDALVPSALSTLNMISVEEDGSEDRTLIDGSHGGGRDLQQQCPPYPFYSIQICPIAAADKRVLPTDPDGPGGPIPLGRRCWSKLSNQTGAQRVCLRAFPGMAGVSFFASRYTPCPLVASKVLFKMYDMDAQKTIARKKEYLEPFAFYGNKFVNGFNRYESGNPVGHLLISADIYFNDTYVVNNISWELDIQNCTEYTG